ncbi:MAG TPA: acetyl-CoA C-acetyltransferase [Acidimicrobiales bacterium]|nr:acetyl-CoA C-acetyltransferase [Acidimicrobiales bacterium]
MTDAVIVATARSPIGRAFKGSLVDARPDDLTVAMVKAALGRVPQLDPSEIEDVMIGCGSPAGEQGFNIARVVAVMAGLEDVPGTTVNRYCSSSLQTIRMAAHAIRAGEGDAFIAGGVECVSRYGHGASDGGNAANHLFDGARERSKERELGGAPKWTPPAGLPDIYIAMGQTAENVRELEGVSRREMDEFALLSQQRAGASMENGFFEREIVPYTLPDGTVVSKDDGPRPDTTIEKLSQLKPAFRPDGEVTAGNSCPLNDGAAAVVVMSDTRARELGITPLARIVSSAVTGLDPEIMGLGPIEACRKAMARAGMTIDDIDLVEINEAFAAQVVPSARHLGIPWDKLNVHGGGIALGHPFGMTGARIMTTLLNGLESTDKTIGMESMCVGGGQGMAMIVERL